MTDKLVKLRFLSDPGHGWLEVPKSLLTELNIAQRITGYSYVHGQFAYLEEDMDAGCFMKAAKEAGYTVEFHELNSNMDSPIRNYRRWEKP